MMQARSRCIAVSVLLALAVAATAMALPHEDKRTVNGDAHLMEESMRLLAAGGARVVAKKDAHLMEVKKLGGGAVATQGDDQGSSSGGEHSREGEGGNKEGEKHSKNCITKEACHKKKIICGKECTLSAHSKCAAKCSKSCVPTC